MDYEIEAIKSFQQSLFFPLLDGNIDTAEVGLDNFLDDGIVKDIPIFGTLSSIIKTGFNIYAWNLLRQTKAFLFSFDGSTISEKKRIKYKNKIKSNSKKARDEAVRALVILNRNVDIEKSKVLGMCYRLFVLEEISRDDFFELSDMIDRFYISDIDTLKEVYENNGVSSEMPVTYRHDRLVSLGIIANTARLTGGAKIRYVEGEADILYLTDIGRKFCLAFFGNK